MTDTQSASPSVAATLVTPSIKRRLATLPYEGLLVLALIVIAAFPVSGLKGATLSGVPHLLFQAYLFCVTAAYFTWFWRHGGQTLAMKTWRFRVVSTGGGELNFATALTRFICALLFYGPACVGTVLFFFPDRVNPVITMWAFLPLAATILWARHDSDRQFLHDRMAGTRLVDAKRA
ncbi:MAG: RDD family protein [Burkholderiales bacterium]|nr:RDD family protein [Burkholderiales bacterium]